MIGTESKLWRHLAKWLYHDEAFDRIESPITPGASDVTYVAGAYSGWIELKTAAMPRPGKPLRLHSPYTTQQLKWLAFHHYPAINLRSWLLIGIIGRTTWKGFVLCDPAGSAQFVQGRPPRPFNEPIESSINEVLTRIRR